MINYVIIGILVLMPGNAYLDNLLLSGHLQTIPDQIQRVNPIKTNCLGLTRLYLCCYCFSDNCCFGIYIPGCKRYPYGRSRNGMAQHRS